MSHNDLHLATTLYTAVDRGDLDAIRPHLAHDLVVEVPDGLPWSGRQHGPDGFFTFLGTLFSHVETRIRTDQVFDAGQAIVHLGRTAGTVRATGTAFDAPEVHLLRFRDHALVHFQVFVDVPSMHHALTQRAATH